MKVIFVYDALCGWCYGFAPVMEAYYRQYASTVDIEVLSGGMLIRQRVEPLKEMAAYIRQVHKEVERVSGVKFGEAFLTDTLEKGEFLMDSLPPAIALSVFKQHNPREAVLFAGAIQRAVYYHGKDPNDYQLYGALAAKWGWDQHAFVEQMNLPAFEQEALNDFERTKNLGVSGFPAVFLEDQGQLQPLTVGYTGFEELEARFLSCYKRRAHKK